MKRDISTWKVLQERIKQGEFTKRVQLKGTDNEYNFFTHYWERERDRLQNYDDEDFELWKATFARAWLEKHTSFFQELESFKKYLERQDEEA